MTRITWLLPVRNGMPYLPETLAAIANQTHQDWRMLAWDNGSTDGTLEELRRWIPERIPGTIVSDRPLPLGICLATMVEECETELCARIDADDICMPERLERQMAFLDTHPEVAAVGTATEKIDSQGVNHGLYHHPPTDHYGILCEMIHSNALAHPSVLFRRAAILEVGNYANVKVEDYELWQRVAQRFHLANLAEPLLQYRVHAKSLVGQFVASGQYRRMVASDCAPSAAALYGASVSDMKQLRERKHPFALKPLSHIARYLKTQRAAGAGNVWRDPIFLLAAQQTLSPIDLCGAVSLGILDPRLGLRGGFKLFVKNLLDFLHDRPEMESVRAMIAYRRQQQWRRRLRGQGATVPPTLEIIGESRPLDNIKIGAGSTIGRDTSIWISTDTGSNGILELAERVYIGRNTFIGTYQPITIGPNVLIGAYSYITSANHRYTRRDIPIRDQGFSGAPIVIEEDVWIGTHVTILPGVTIGRGAIVGAGSVVSKDIPAYEIWGGAPARFLKHRPESVTI